MRLRKLAFPSYGIFTDVELDFGEAGAHDLHVIYGPNEAGKSTIRKGLVEALYGMAKSTPYNFVHEYTRLKIGATVEHNGQSLSFERIKKRKSLISPQGDELSDDAVAAFLEGVDQGMFERVYALDHHALAAASAEMLDPKGSFGQLLFQSTAGLKGFSAMKDRIAEEAKAQWALRGQNNAVAQARELFDRARQQVKDAALGQGQYNALDREVREALREKTEADEAFAAATRERARLQRIKAVGPLLLRLVEAERRVAEMEDAPQLPKGAIERVRSARDEIQNAEQEAREARERAKTAAAELAETPDNAEILAVAARIEEAINGLASYEDAARDLPGCEQEARLAAERIAGLLKDVGWPDSLALEGDGLSGIVALLPTDGALRTARATVASTGEQLSATDTLEHQAQRARQQAVRSAADLAAMQAPADAAGLRRVIEAARVHLQSARGRDLETESAEARAQLTRALEKVGSEWTVERLRQVTPPSVSALRAALKALADSEQSITQAQQDMRGVDADIAELNRNIESLRTRSGAVSEDDVQQARDRRDSLFNDVLAAPQSHEQGYRDAVRGADGLADQRYAAHTEGARLEAARDSLSGKQAKRETIERDAAQAGERQKAALGDYEALIAEAGMAGVSPAGVNEWLALREVVLERATAVERLERQAKADADEAKRHVELLGRECPGDTDVDLESMLASAEAHLLAIDKAREAHVAAAAKARHDEQEAKDKEQAHADSKKMSDQAKARMDTVCTKVGVAGGSVAETRERLDAVGSLAEVCRELASLRAKRISPMQESIDKFEKSVEELCRPLGITERAGVGARLLRSRLRDARECNRVRGELATDVRRLTEDAERFDKKAIAAAAAVQDLKAAAGLEDLGELESAARRSEQRREADESLVAIRSLMLDAGQGMDIDALRNEAQGIAPDELSAQVERASAAEAEARERYTAASTAHTLAQQKFVAAGGSDAAAVADAQKHNAASKMAEAAENYIRARASELLLTAAIERYRESRQGPIMAAASHYFTTITGGRFSRLLVPNADEPDIAAELADGGRIIPRAGFSEGTRDQVYLSLRLAGIERTAQAGACMPLLADDLLMTWDDERAGRGFAALADLSTKGVQVIYFTHHRHLIDVALAGSEGRANVIEL